MALRKKSCFDTPKKNNCFPRNPQPWDAMLATYENKRKLTIQEKLGASHSQGFNGLKFFFPLKYPTQIHSKSTGKCREIIDIFTVLRLYMYKSLRGKTSSDFLKRQGTLFFIILMGLPSKLITKLYKVPKFDMAGCYLEAVVLIEHQILQTNLHGHASD